MDPNDDELNPAHTSLDGYPTERPDFTSGSAGANDDSYPSDPDVAKQEDSQGNSAEANDANTATQREQASLGQTDSGAEEKGGFVRNAASYFNQKTATSGINMAKAARKRGLMVGAGILMLVVVTIASILFTFNIPSAQIRAAGNGLFMTYLGSQVMQNNIHFGNYWNGEVSDYLRQSCKGTDCTLKAKPKSFLEAAGQKNIRTAINKLTVKGIQLTTENGKFTGLKINTEKTTSPYPTETNPAKLKAAIEAKTGFEVNVEKVSTGSRYGADFKVTTKSLTGFRAQRMLNAVAVQAGAIDTFPKKVGSIRNTAKVLGLGFKPLQMLREAYSSKINGAVDSFIKSLLEKSSGGAKSASVVVDGKDKEGKSSTSETTGSSYEDMKQSANKFLESKGGKAAGGALAAVGVVCVVSALIDGTSDLVLHNNLYPASRLATTYMAANDQASSVTDHGTDWQGIDAFSRMLETRNSDGTINSFSQSATWKHMNGMGGGKEMDKEHAIAFGMQAPDASVQKVLGDVLSAVGKTFCAGTAGSFITAAGIAIMVLSGPAAIVEGVVVAGTLMAAMPIAIKALAGSELNFVNYQNDPAGLYNFAGAGAKATRDITSFSHGGGPQSSADQAKYSRLAFEEQAAALQSKNLVARIFDIQDPLTPIGKLAANSSRYPSQNLAMISHSFVSVFSSSLKTIGTLFTGKAFAATTPQSRYDICSQDKWGCIGMSEAVMNDDGSIAKQYLSRSDLIESDSKLVWMKNCHDDEFYRDPKLDNMWTFRVVDDTPAYFAHLTGNSKSESKCNDTNIINDPVIISLMSYTNLEPQIAMQACADAATNSTDDMDSAACAKVGYDESGDATGVGQTPASSTIDTSKLYQDTTSIACDPRTKPLGIQEVHHGDSVFKINICGISLIPSHGLESKKGSGYYVEGAEGMSIVNSIVSGAFQNLAEDAKAKNIPLTSGSTFRAYEHQNKLWIDNGKQSDIAAPPGKSNHEVAIAIDFSIPNVPGETLKRGAKCSSRATYAHPNTDAGKIWLYLNGTPSNPGAQRFGIYQYAAEAWHWDASPTRCQESYPVGGG